MAREKRLARHNLVAAFGTAEDGLEVLRDLGEAGLTADELSLVAPDLEKRPGAQVPREAADTTSTGLGTALGLGIGTGAVTGGVLGAIVGAGVTLIPGVGLAAGAGALYAAVAGAAAGHIAGGLLGVEAGARKQMMWAEALHPLVSRVDTEGLVLVGVHSDDKDRIDIGEERLQGFDAIEVHRFEADESYEPPGRVTAVAGRDVPSTHPEHPGTTAEGSEEASGEADEAEETQKPEETNEAAAEEPEETDEAAAS